MDVITERDNSTLIATVTGRIDGSTARDFEATMTSAISAEDLAVIVDLEGVSYISSAGLRAMLLVAKDLSRRGAKFALCSLTREIQEVFEIAGFNKILAIHDSRDAALIATTG